MNTSACTCGKSEWIFREWAPNAEAVYLVGVMTAWQEQRAFALEKVKPEGVWEIRLPADAMAHGDLYRLRVHWPGGAGDRIPVYARRVVQDPDTLIFIAQVWVPDTGNPWTCTDFKPPPGSPLHLRSPCGHRSGGGAGRHPTRSSGTRSCPGSLRRATIPFS